MGASGVTTLGTYLPDKLIAGEFPRIVRKVTLTGGAPAAKGAVLGRITASGKYLLSLAAANDGSEVPEAILAEAADATGGDVDALVYLTGEFNEAALTFGTGHTAASTRQGLRLRSIFLTATVAA